MLNIFIRNEDKIPSNIEVITNVEEAFGKLNGIPKNEITKGLVKSIEKSELVDSDTVIDRFGYKLRLADISTGCKAALLVSLSPERIIDLKECGSNAIDAIVMTIKNGKVLMRYPSKGFDDADFEGRTIECKNDKYVFKSVDDLNHYLLNDKPFDFSGKPGNVRVVKE